MTDGPDTCVGPWANFEEIANDSRWHDACRGFYNPCTGQCFPTATGYRADDFTHLWVEPYASVIYGIIYPILLLLTVIANIFVVLVLTKRHMRTPTNTVLLYMALADLCVALVPFPFLFVYFMLGFRLRIDELDDWWCYLAHYAAADVLPPICHNAAIWLTLLLAGQRYVYVRFPLRSAIICTVRHVNIATMAILVLVFCGSFPRFIDIAKYTVVKYNLYSPNAEFEAIIANRTGMSVSSLISSGSNNSALNSSMVIPGVLSLSEHNLPTKDSLNVLYSQRLCVYKYTEAVLGVGENNFFSFYYWTRVVVFVLIPSGMLLLFTSLLILELRAAKQRRCRLLTYHNSSASINNSLRTQTNSSRVDNAVVAANGTATTVVPQVPQRTAATARDHTTMMLVMIVMVFLVVNLPQGIILALFCIQQTFGSTFGDFLNGRIMAIAMMIDNMLILLTYPLNFAIYCFMSAAFRESFKALFCRSITVDLRRNSMYQANTVVTNGHNTNRTVGTAAVKRPTGNSFKNCTAAKPANGEDSEETRAPLINDSNKTSNNSIVSAGSKPPIKRVISVDSTKL